MVHLSCKNLRRPKMGSGVPKKNFLIRLSSKGLCFICLRDTAITDNGNDPPEARLRNITRFLGIDTKSILRNHFTCELSKCEGVKVKLCVECSSVMEKFSSLYQTLEVTRLKLNQCLNRIQELIHEADRDNARVEEMKERVTHAPTAGVMEEMRRRVLKRCLKTMNGAPPRVIVERMSSKVPDHSSPSAEDTDNFDEKSELEAGSSLVPDDDDQVSTQPEPESAEETSETPKSSMILRPRRSPRVTTEPSPKKPLMRPSLRKIRKNKFCCPRCDYKSVCELNTELHIAERHCDQYFVEHRLPSVSSEQFQKIVSNLLFKGMFEKLGAGWRCNFCSKKVAAAKTANSVSLKIHLVKKHYEELVEKLMTLQGDPDILKEAVKRKPKPLSSKSRPKHEKGTSAELSCPHCRVVMRNPSNIKYRLYAHLVRHHLEKYFEPEDKYKEKSLTSLQFKQILYHLLFQSIGLKKGKEVKCRWCPKQYNYGSVGTATMLELKIHWVKKHHSLLCNRLRELQTGPELAQKLKEIHSGHQCKCGAYIVNSQVLRTHQTKFCNLGNKKVFAPSSVLKKVYMRQQIFYSRPCTCSLCGARIPARRDKRQHAANRHCEQYFLEYRDSNISSTAFKTLIDLELFKHSEIKENRLGCLYCYKESKLEQNYLRKGDLRIHMIDFHFKELIQRVRELQRDFQEVRDLGHQENCGTPKETGTTSRRHDQNSSPPPVPCEGRKRSSHEKPCPHCKAVILSQHAYHMTRNFENHLLHHHLETYFLPEEEFKEPSLSSFQFKQVLEHLLFENINTGDKVNGPQQCPHCPRIFKLNFETSGLLYLKLHLIKDHRELLTERLMELQKNPEVLLAKLEKTTGFACKCGAYFSSRQVYRSHEWKFCNLVNGTTSNGEGTTDVTGNIPEHSKCLEVDDDDDEDEDECALLLPQDSESEHGRDPLALEYKNKCEVDDEPEPEATDLKSVGIDTEEFVFLAKVEEEPPLVKIERKRRSTELVPESECLPEKVAKFENDE